MDGQDVQDIMVFAATFRH